jgi:mono/diheme cytochrome c family protein
VTEIPEHLLKRSRERRSAMGQGDDDGAAASDATPATTPAGSASPAATPPPPSGPTVRGAAPEAAAPEPPKPDAPYVAAAKQRRKIPFWAMATLSLMPIWGFMYVRALTESPEVAEGPLAEGAEVYGNCASCHGTDGGGGIGYPFAGGEVLQTFPNIEDQIRYVFWGTEGFNLERIEVYGNPDREGGAHTTGARGAMPAFGAQLQEHEIVSVVCHERYALSGADPTSEEYAEEFDTWCGEEAPAWQAVETGEFSLTSNEAPAILGEGGALLEITPIGDPVEGSP